MRTACMLLQETIGNAMTQGEHVCVQSTAKAACAGIDTATWQHCVPAVSTGPGTAQCCNRAKTTVHHADWLQADYQCMLAANPYVSCTTVMKLTVLTLDGQEPCKRLYRRIICTYFG